MRYPRWLFAVVLLAFISQLLMAHAVPCHAQGAAAHAYHQPSSHAVSPRYDDNRANDHRAVNDHHRADDHQGISDPAKSGLVASDCCDPAAQCASMNCALPGLTSMSTNPVLMEPRSEPYQYRGSLPDELVSPLYRPPISL